jgi:DNA polymerase-3 subunit chi
MNEVSYHVIRDSRRVTTPMLVCRLVQARWRAGQTVYIRAQDAKQARQLDDLLWTFDQSSFIPHRLAEDQQAPAPVVIGTGLPEPPPQVLINLARDVPENCECYPSIIEVVDPAAADSESARARYRRYRESGCALSTIDA